MTIYFGGQNQKNGHSSLPEAPNAKPNTDSESTSKNTSKKIGLKKVFITPTQNIGDFRFLTNLSLCSLVLAMKMIDSIGSMISRAKGHGSCLSAPDFSISVPVSWKMRPKLGDFWGFFDSFCQFMRRWDQNDQNGLDKNDQ